MDTPTIVNPSAQETPPTAPDRQAAAAVPRRRGALGAVAIGANRTAVALLVLLLVATAIAAAVVRLTVRDTIDGVAILYYAVPPLAMTIFLVLAAVGCAWLRWRRAAVGLVGLSLATGGWTGASAFHWNPQQHDPTSIRILYWNAARGVMGWDAIVKAIRSYDADIIAIVEGAQGYEKERKFWAEQFPEYQARYGVDEMMILSRIPVGPQKFGFLARNGFSATYELRPEGRSRAWLTITDMTSHIGGRRQPQLEALAELMKPYASEPSIIVGDFNTPRDSVFLAGLREDYRHVFETAGRGFDATWPTFAPMLSIDQAWVSSRVRLLNAQLEWTLLSDHRPLVFEVTWE